MTDPVQPFGAERSSATGARGGVRQPWHTTSNALRLARLRSSEMPLGKVADMRP